MSRAEGFEQPRRFYVRTYGCQMNEHDSERIAGLLASEGMEATDDLESAAYVRELFDEPAARLYQITGLLESYQFSRASLELYDVLWGELCDWYIELVKPRLYEEGADKTALSANLLMDAPIEILRIASSVILPGMSNELDKEMKALHRTVKEQAVAIDELDAKNRNRGDRR